MDANFLSIPIISCEIQPLFNFFQKFFHFSICATCATVAQVARCTNIFATLLISAIYDLKYQGLQINEDTNMFEVISNNPYAVVPAVC